MLVGNYTILKRFQRNAEMLMFVLQDGYWMLWSNGRDIRMFECTESDIHIEEDKVWYQLDRLLMVCAQKECIKLAGVCESLSCKCIGRENK